jgi:hypothetical protein
VAVLNATPAGPLGFLNPRLYSLSGTAVFQDIADKVSNASDGAPGYTSGPGWDACTGLGSLNGAALFRALDPGKAPDPCESIREDLENISPGDFRTDAEYQRVRTYLTEQLHDCMRRYHE